MHLAASGNVQVPIIDPAAVGTHFAGAPQGGVVGSVLQGPLSPDCWVHVPLVAVGVAIWQKPCWQLAYPVIGAAPRSPQGWTLPTSVMAWHVPTLLPFAVGMQARPRSPSQLAAVFREPSHGAPTV
jgi:hypothetical protein